MLIIKKILGNIYNDTVLNKKIEDYEKKLTQSTLHALSLEFVKFLKFKSKNSVIIEKPTGRFQKKFSRTKYEKFLLVNNLTAPYFETSLKKSELRDNLFAYIGGGIKSPFFITNNIFQEETKKLDIKYINLANIYKKRESFTNKEIQSYVDLSLIHI